MVRLRSLYTILTKGNKLWRSDCTKGRGIWASRDGKLWEGKYMGKLMEDKDYFSKGCLCRLILQLTFHLLAGGKTPGKGDLWQSSLLRNFCFYSDKGSSKKASFCTCLFANDFNSK